MTLIEELAEYSDDPYGFVLWAFPWGEEGTELEDQDGPEPWQQEILEQLGEGVINVNQAVQLARTSGHGIGKSACVSWIILWAISTFEDTKGVVTANTENQLKTKTWAEVAKWHRLFIAAHLFKMTATALFSNDPAHEKTWRIDMVPWSERNTEAFAGLHNRGKRIIVIFDEASAIPDVIWEVTEGALTDKDTQIIWAVFGNPTKNKGRFRECFHGGRFSHRWQGKAIDSRSVSITDKELFAKWAADYGEDSDFFRVRVRGVFPRVDAESFISLDSALEATNREIFPQSAAVVLGVDVARFGNDASCIFPRCGRDARSRPPEVYYGLDTMQFATKVAAAALKYHATALFVDSGGVGGGVVDRLRQLRFNVIEVDFGSKPDGVNEDDQSKYANKRAEIWGALRGWLRHGSIPELATGENTTLVSELTAPNYGLNNKEEILLESKKDMRRRGVASPNCADALALTFAMPSMMIDIRDPRQLEMELKPVVCEDYDPFSKDRMYG
ncbi:MAG TPA: terminase [Opitutaceae bacterium]